MVTITERDRILSWALLLTATLAAAITIISGIAYWDPAESPRWDRRDFTPQTALLLWFITLGHTGSIPVVIIPIASTCVSIALAFCTMRDLRLRLFACFLVLWNLLTIGLAYVGIFAYYLYFSKPLDG